MLALVAALFGFSFRLNNWRALPKSQLNEQSARRAPLAEHGWEETILANLTLSNPSWE